MKILISKKYEPEALEKDDWRPQVTRESA